MKKQWIVVLAATFVAAPSIATHSWSTYHWERSSNPLTLTLINSTTDDWDQYVSEAVGDWNVSLVISLTEDMFGDTSNRTRRQCRGPSGGIRICNLAYGNTGWLGIAGISVDSGGHITTGYTKMNDTYFADPYYDNDLWKQSVTCQEIGHNLGLDHQDEDFNNMSLKTCMDYQDPPWPSPNSHDYEQLAQMYQHTDGGSGGGGSCNAPPGKGCNKNGSLRGNNGDIGWGISLGRRGQKETFMRIDPDGTRHIVFVTWAIGH